MFDQLVGRKAGGLFPISCLHVGQPETKDTQSSRAACARKPQRRHFIPVANLNFIYSIGIQNEPNGILIALWAKLLRKWEIGKFNKITSWPLIFWKTLLFQMNLEENVTFTFYFFSFASNFPCKILWDNKNIDANIFIFSNSIFTMKGVRSKKVILRFFLKHKKI